MGGDTIGALERMRGESSAFADGFSAAMQEAGLPGRRHQILAEVQSGAEALIDATRKMDPLAEREAHTMLMLAGRRLSELQLSSWEVLQVGRCLEETIAALTSRGVRPLQLTSVLLEGFVRAVQEHSREALAESIVSRLQPVHISSDRAVLFLVGNLSAEELQQVFERAARSLIERPPTELFVDCSALFREPGEQESALVGEAVRLGAAYRHAVAQLVFSGLSEAEQAQAGAKGSPVYGTLAEALVARVAKPSLVKTLRAALSLQRR